MIDDLEIPDAARPYLIAQRGQISHLSHSPKEWDLVYRQSLMADFEQMRPALPDYAPLNVLDIGAGMGGVDIVLDRFYRKYAPSHPSTFWLMDGLDDGPEVQRSWLTHSNFRPLSEFMIVNGVADTRYLGPNQLQHVPDTFDLIISLRAWCFHFEPNRYLDQALRLSRPNTIFIVDLRKNRLAWEAQLAGRLEPFKQLGETAKSKRWAFRRLDYAD